jgi:2-dehydropantoate 2-reductase
MQQFHWHILGAGAIGSLIACYMAKNEQPVTLIGKEKRLHPIILEADDKTLTLPVPVETAATLKHPIEFLLVTTKAHQVKHAMESIKQHIAPHAVIILMHNGMGVLQELDSHWRQYRLLLATTTLGALRISPSHIKQTGIGKIWVGKPVPKMLDNKVVCGNYLSSKDSNCEFLTMTAVQVQKIMQSLRASHLPIEWDEHIEQRLWLKLAINAAINPITALLNCRNGELLEHSPAIELVNKLCEETERIFKAKNIHLSSLAQHVTEVLKNTAKNYSSMHQDVQHGRQTEIAYINGYLINCAEKYGVAMPIHQTLTSLIRLREHYQKEHL